MASLTLDPRRAFLPLIGGLIAVAWLALAVWELSPYGRYLDHGRWTELGLAAALCRALPAGSALLYVGGWVLMTAAMMLPTTLPLLGLFWRLVEARPDRAVLLALVIAGYLSIWSAFGLAAHAVDYGLHELTAELPWLVANGWVLGAGVLAAAVAFHALHVRGRHRQRRVDAGAGALMAIEKNVSWGRRLSAPLGIALLGGASLIVLGQAAERF